MLDVNILRIYMSSRSERWTDAVLDCSTRAGSTRNLLVNLDLEHDEYKMYVVNGLIMRDDPDSEQTSH